MCIRDSGRTLYEQIDDTRREGELMFTLPLRTLPAGVYSVRVMQGGAATATQLMVIH